MNIVEKVIGYAGALCLVLLNACVSAQTAGIPDKGISSVPDERPIDFCELMDEMNQRLSDPLLRLTLSPFFTHHLSLIAEMTCESSDLNGARLMVEGEGDGAGIPSPNGLNDARLELAVLAELLNNPQDYAALDGGVDATELGDAFRINYAHATGAFSDDEMTMETMIDNVRFFAQSVLEGELEGELARVAMYADAASVFVRKYGLIIAGYFTLGDKDSVDFALEFVTAVNSATLTAFQMTTDRSYYLTNDGILGSSGDADGDGCTQAQEYAMLACAGPVDPAAYVAAVLTPNEFSTCEPEGECVGPVDGEGGAGDGEGEGGIDGEGIADGEGEAATEGEEGEGGAERYHSTDSDQDHAISLEELLGAIQLYNAGQFHCGDSLGAYVPGVGDTSCIAHTADYLPQDWSLNLSELLRQVQIFSVGVYGECDSPDLDGFCLS